MYVLCAEVGKRNLNGDTDKESEYWRVNERIGKNNVSNHDYTNDRSDSASYYKALYYREMERPLGDMSPKNPKSIYKKKRSFFS